MKPQEDKIDTLSIYVAENFGSLKTELINIKDHLARLNGQVAKNVLDIGDIKLKANTQDGQISNVTSWRIWLMPTLSALLTGMTIYIITRL